MNNIQPSSCIVFISIFSSAIYIFCSKFHFCCFFLFFLLFSLSSFYYPSPLCFFLPLLFFRFENAHERLFKNLCIYESFSTRTRHLFKNSLIYKLYESRDSKYVKPKIYNISSALRAAVVFYKPFI